MNEHIGINLGNDSELFINLDQNTTIILEKYENPFPLRLRTIINGDMTSAIISLNGGKLEILYSKEITDDGEMLLPIGYGLNEH